MTPSVQVAGVTVHHGPVLALDRVDLELHPGTVCGLVGMNGSGKSTLIKTILGMLTPDVGTVTVDGGSPADARRRSLLGYVPQSEDIDRDFPLSVHDVVATGRYGRLGPTRRLRGATGPPSPTRSSAST